jgi:hypothetical protein
MYAKRWLLCVGLTLMAATSMAFPVWTNTIQYNAAAYPTAAWTNFSWTWSDRDDQWITGTFYGVNGTQASNIEFRLGDSETWWLTISNGVYSGTSTAACWSLATALANSNVPPPATYYGEFLLIGSNGIVTRTLAKGKVKTDWSLFSVTNAADWTPQSIVYEWPTNWWVTMAATVASTGTVLQATIASTGTASAARDTLIINTQALNTATGALNYAKIVNIWATQALNTATGALNYAKIVATSNSIATSIANIHVTGIKYVSSSNIVVSGAGSNIVDGTYVPGAWYAGLPTWTNETGASVIFASGAIWYINSEVNGGFWYYYDNGTGSGPPLSGTWDTYTDGTLPVPALSYSIQTGLLTEAVGLYSPTGTLGTAAYQASSAFDAAGSALAATNGLAAPLMAFTPTSRWVSSASGIATGLTVRGGTVTARLTSTLDQGFMAAITNGYGVITTNTDATGYAFMAAQNNSEDVLSFGVRGTAAAGTLFGQTNAGAAQVYSFAAPLLLGSYGSDPVVLGVDNAERFRMTSSAGNTNVADLVVTGSLTAASATISGATTNTGGAFYPGTTFEDDQLATAGWVRDLLSIGEPVYMASNTEAVGYYPGTASKGINEASAGNYVSPSVTITGSPQYVHSMIGTQVLSGTLLGPASVDVYVWRKGTGPVGNQSASLAAELYYTMDKTNLFGDWSAPAQTIPSGTNKLSYVISFPNTDVTNAYLVYRLKITAAANTTNINVLGGETYGSYALLRIPNTDSLGVRGATNLTDVGLVYTSRYDTATRTLVVGPTGTASYIAMNGGSGTNITLMGTATTNIGLFVCNSNIIVKTGNEFVAQLGAYQGYAMLYLGKPTSTNIGWLNYTLMEANSTTLNAPRGSLYFSLLGASYATLTNTGFGINTSAVPRSLSIGGTNATIAIQAHSASTSMPAALTNCAQLFATNIVSAELQCMDGAGNVTELSSHEGLTHIARSFNVYTGTGRVIDLDALADAVTQLTGKTNIIRRFTTTRRDWDAEQRGYVYEREVARTNATKALADWTALSAEEQAKQEKPVVQPALQAVPKPKWLTDWEAKEADK